MKKISLMLWHHLKEDFNIKAYALLLLFLVISLGLNYYFDFEDDYVDKVSLPFRIPAKILFFLIPYVAACAIVLPFYNKTYILFTREYWIPVLFIFICLGFDSGFPVYEWIIKGNFHHKTHLWLSKVIYNSINILFILVPAYVFYRLQQEKNYFYGLTKKFDPWPYLSILLLMVPVLLVASKLENFSNFYPMYKTSQAGAYWGIPETWMIVIHELFYGWNFLSVEFVFRGFLVIGMVRVLGRQTILPMVAVYCVYHFGKPEGEAISSIFGGYILGVIAYETRSILGGVLIHVGIAWLMELFGFLQK